MSRTLIFTLIGAGVGVMLTSVGVIKYFLYKKRLKKRKSYPKDVVILHQFPPNGRTPSFSAYAMKLETWLRMADIKYQNDFVMLERSAKGKIPWITLNNVDVSDSQFCIEFLTKWYGKDLNDNLTQMEKSISRAFLKLVEGSLVWVGLITRFKYGKKEDCGMSFLSFLIGGRKMLKQAYYQGYGLHSKEEIIDIGKADLKALEEFLSNKKYLFGDIPCVEDAVIFSFSCQFIHNDRSELNKYITTNCPSLMRHFNLIKETYWPDWNERIQKK